MIVTDSIFASGNDHLPLFLSGLLLLLPRTVVVALLFLLLFFLSSVRSIRAVLVLLSPRRASSILWIVKVPLTYFLLSPLFFRGAVVFSGWLLVEPALCW